MTNEIAESLLQRCLAGKISPAVTVARMMAATGSTHLISAAIDRAEREFRLSTGALHGNVARLHELRALVGSIAPGCEGVAAVLRQSDPADGGGSATASGDVSGGDAIRRCRSFFDAAVQQSEEASVALYSLGDAALLDRATAEIVHLLRAWQTLTPMTTVLDVGCGIGRVARALAGSVGRVHGLDISEGMIAAARRRCAGLNNVTLEVGSGLGFESVATEEMDLVIGVDSFPYLHASGTDVVERHFQETARVLGPGGDFVILNFSYRGDVEQDVQEIDRLAASHGLDVLVTGARPFTLWDGVAFHLRRGPAGTRLSPGSHS